MSVIKPRSHGKHLIEHRTVSTRRITKTQYACAAFVAEEPDLERLGNRFQALCRSWLAPRRTQ